jgi:succinoglycan biosynthesis protein ExoO
MTNDDGNAPRVSVIMANYNGAAHIAEAVQSVLRQTEPSLELLLSDDGSSDDSVARARAAAAGDRRLRVIEGARRSGAGAARNRALEAAAGVWTAIVDSDDFIHPQRLQRLIAAAGRDGADIVADDLLAFHQAGDRPPRAHLGFRQPQWVTAARFESSNCLFGAGPALGYLKPLFRHSSLRYDESLPIGEDADLLLRMLIAGARMRVYPELGYFYRKHPHSVSHRLSVAAIDAMSAAYARIDPLSDATLAHALKRGRLARAEARAFAVMVETLKSGKPLAALGQALKHPAAVLHFSEAIAKRLAPPASSAPEKAHPPRIALLSRQRIVGATNGSSAYVLSLAASLKQLGYAVDYIGASPKIFGRWAIMRLRPEVQVFDRYLVNGGVRAGDVMLARDPGVWLAAALAVAERALAKAGLKRLNWSQPAEYAQAAPDAKADQIFIARAARGEVCAVLCDYAFLTPMAPYALAPRAPSLIIMHDLMSARVADSAEINAVKLAADDEFALLGAADAVIAIQPDEAKAVRAALPQTCVMVVPYAAATAPAAQPGRDDTLLFVGSNTAANIIGLQRFFAEIWPLVRARRPHASLAVAGSVARSLGPAPEGVSILGVAADLAPLYRDAGVVISPLFTGSGLKIKLIEAMAAGKAIVGTSVTLQGVEEMAGAAIRCHDDAAGFADAAATLLGDTAARTALGRKALACAQTHFSPSACFAPLAAFLRGGGAARGSRPDAEILASQ